MEEDMEFILAVYRGLSDIMQSLVEGRVIPAHEQADNLQDVVFKKYTELKDKT